MLAMMQFATLQVEQFACRISARERNHSGFAHIFKQVAYRRTRRILERFCKIDTCRIEKRAQYCCNEDELRRSR